jgi:small subunit ribosomal protein S24e
MSLKIKILSKKHNPLLKRQEVLFEVDHSQEGETSSRLELRKSLASMLKVDLDRVFVERVETKTGTMIALGEANAYESPDQARLVEREHIITRNAPPAKGGEPKDEAKPVPPVPEAAKEEAPSKTKADEAAKPAPKPAVASAAAPQPATKPEAEEPKDAEEAGSKSEATDDAPKPEAAKEKSKEEA